MKKILLTTIAVAAFAQGASALEAGKMYMRADLGYNFSSPKLGDEIANGKDTGAILKGTKASNRLKGFAGDIGFGYALSDSIRTDVTLNISQGKKKLKDVTLTSKVGDVDVKTPAKIHLKEKKLGLMANAYYDFNNASEFTPYVMAGVGVNRGSLEAKIDGDNGKADAEKKDTSATIKSKNLTSVAYQVGVGVGYEMAKDITLDVGYKMSGTSGSYKFKKDDVAKVTGATDKVKFAKPKLQHTVTAGVRFAF